MSSDDLQDARDPSGTEAMESLLVEYIRSYSRFYSRPDSKTLQRAEEQLYQEREMQPLVGRLTLLCGSLENASVLEVGSGSGARAVAVALAGARVAGIEPSEAGVAASNLRAARYPWLRAVFHVGVGERLPFPDESFDLVFSTEVLQHVQNLDLVLAESSRVLRRGGYCYHEMPNGLHPFEFHYRIVWLPHTPKPLGKLYAKLRGKDPRHLDDTRFLYYRSLSKKLRKHGFAEIGDLYFEELKHKVAEPSALIGHSKRRVAMLSRRVGLSRVLLPLLLSMHVHAQMRVHARKVV